MEEQQNTLKMKLRLIKRQFKFYFNNYVSFFFMFFYYLCIKIKSAFNITMKVTQYAVKKPLCTPQN